MYELFVLDCSPYGVVNVAIKQVQINWNFLLLGKFTDPIMIFYCDRQHLLSEEKFFLNNRLTDSFSTESKCLQLCPENWSSLELKALKSH